MKIDKFTYFWPERPRLNHINQLEKYNDENHVAEPKYNGQRLELHHLPNDSWQCWNRHGRRMAYELSPELLKDLNGLKLEGYWLFDAELRHNKVVGIRHRIMIYDVFIANGTLLLDFSFRERRAILEVLFHYNGPENGEVLDLIRQYDHNWNFKRVFAMFKDDKEVEGLVVKDLNGKLNLGRTSAAESTWMTKFRKANNSYRF